MKRRRDKPRRGRVRDPGFLADVKLTGGCWVGDLRAAKLLKATPCTSRVPDADHSGRRGISQKSHDRESADICWGHHKERTDRVGTFKGMPVERERELLNAAIERTQGRVGRWRKPAIEF